MSDELKLGDVVELKSGGPKMTVNSPESEKAVECKWFPYAHDKQGGDPPLKATFKIGTLKHSEVD